MRNLQRLRDLALGTVTLTTTYQLTVRCKNGAPHTTIKTDGKTVPVDLAQTHDLFHEECAPHSVNVTPVGQLPEQRRWWRRL